MASVARGGSAGKPAAKRGAQTKKPAGKRNVKTAKKKETPKADVRDQHREVWVVITFFLSLVLVFAMLGVEGVVLSPFFGFFKGILDTVKTWERKEG